MRPEFRFPRSSRLTRKSEFDEVLRNPVLRLRQGPLRAFVRRNHAEDARLGIIVGRRQIGSSVKRNRVKRIVRESFRIRRRQLPAVDVVVQVLSADTLSGPTLHASLQALWSDIERTQALR